MVLRAALGSLVIVSAAHAQPAEPSREPAPDPETDLETAIEPEDHPTLDTTSLTDSLLAAPALRPIRGHRVEALVSTGSFGTHRAGARATTRRGGFGLELDGRWLDSAGYSPVAPKHRGVIDGPAAHSRRDAGARLEHISGGSHARAFGRWTSEHRESGTEHQNTNARIARFGGSWTLTRPGARFDLQLFGEHQRLQEQRPYVAADRSSALLASRHEIPLSTHGARAAIRPKRFRTLGIEHELACGVGFVKGTGTARDHLTLDTQLQMALRRLSADHRILDAYIEDTVSFIRTLDVTAGFVVERWRYLGQTTLAAGTEDAMEVSGTDVSKLLASPALSALYRVDDDFAIRGRVHRGLRAPTSDELHRPFLIGDTLTAANQALRPESVWTSELGPEVTAGRLVARATMFVSTIDNAIGSATLDAPLADGAIRQRQNIGAARVAGVATEASWRPTKAWLATVSYTFASSAVTASDRYPHLLGKQLAQAPRQMASAIVTFDDPRVITLTGALRYVDRSFEDDRNTQLLGGYAVVDAIATRTLAGGLSGFVAVDNLFDRRYLVGRTGLDTLGAPRMFHLGLRIDSKRF